MVESAPLFIEYCCTGYMHIDAVKFFIGLVFFLACIAVFASSLFYEWLFRRKSEK